MAAPEWVRVTEVVCLPRSFPLWSLRVPRRDRPGGIAFAPGFAWSTSERAKPGTPREGAGGGGASGGERSRTAERRRAPRTREKGRGCGCGRHELQSSEFWDSSLGAILKSLPKHPAAGEGTTRPSMDKALSAFEKLQLTPPAEEEPGRSRAQGLQCVCYGIGNFSSCVQARYQLAFLLLLLEELKIPEDLCYIFDPVFSTLEIKVLAHLGLTVLLENEEGKRCIHNPTIFYMVHCGKALYNNLLWSNWSIEALSRTVIIGNSFKGIEDRVLSRIFQKDYSYIAKVLIATDEEALPSHPQYLDIFNDTSVHCFPLEKLRELPPEIWKLQEEPVYPDEDQPEIIRNKK
ncbi:SRR1-like protein isoform X1 [Lacerta agilis]|uniref:SRR1-like protein isoform X1 n=1 Tax=Lacerta agilis TaxID=80427 RepID=UPI00141A11F2|nr:SRR1-like protein isoform X1 [Lacerta agilis]